MGGGIYYNLIRPEMENITYINNSAPYGPNIASYSVKIVERGTQNNKIMLEDVPSNLVYDEILLLDLIDFDGQVMALENSASIKILIEDPSLSIRGTDSGRAVNGQATLNGTIFIGEVGLRNAQYLLTSQIIDQRIINEVLDNSGGDYNNLISASFRY